MMRKTKQCCILAIKWTNAFSKLLLCELTEILSTMVCALSLTFITSALTFSAACALIVTSCRKDKINGRLEKKYVGVPTAV